MFFRRSDPVSELWSWFSRNCRRFEAEEPDEEAYRELSRSLKAIDRGLTYELAHAEQWELAISADGAPELIPLVKHVVENSPKVAGWRIVAFRQPSPQPALISVYDHELTPLNVYFTLEKERDLVLYVPGITDENARHVAHCAMLLMESLVGEYALMTQVGEVEYEEADSLPAAAQPLSALPGLIKPEIMSS